MQHKYNRKALRKLLKALTIAELAESLDDFSAVREEFIAEQQKTLRFNIILDYFEKHQELFNQFLEAIKDANSAAYEKYVSDFESSENLNTKVVSTNGTILPSNQTNSISENKNCDILVLAANPKNTQPLQLKEEAELIKKRLQEGEVGKNYLVHTESVASVEDLSRYLLQYDPIILHFAGHSNSEGEIIFQNSHGEAQILSAERLAESISLVKGRIECVVLNACFSLEKADVIADRVQCVIGMNKEIDDESAIKFSGGFYRGLGSGRGYYFGFELGRQQIKNLDLPDSEVPHFITRDTSILQLEVVKPRITRSATVEKKIATLYPLWFGTNRKPVNTGDISQGFTGEIDARLHYGTCQVAVPKSHQIGSTGSPWWKRLLTLSDDRLKLQSESVRVLNEAMFWNSIDRALQEHEPDEHSALVLIHGFNVSFEAAALRAAQIGFDLQVPGIMAFYSWPSKGKLLGYTADGASIEASEKYIAEFLLNLAQKSEIEKIHIIAHSMGNRGLLRAMDKILTQVQTASEISFGQIFLAAPDVEPNLFRDLAKAYKKLSERTTLYISSKDKALATSGIIHNRPRVGFFPPITVVDGIDTVEVSNIDLTLLGHGYFADARILLEDIYELMNHNTSPNNRRSRLQTAQDGNYWIMRK